MKRSASTSAAPASVRFLNITSASDDTGSDAAVGPPPPPPAPEEDQPAAAASEQAVEHPCSALTEPTSAAATHAADNEVLPPPPVAPPRKYSVRSRADEWRGAIQDLSPVKELVSRLGKVRSSSLDHSAGASAPAAIASDLKDRTDSKDRTPGKEKTADVKDKAETPDSRSGKTEVDAWSRLSELRGKITKTVEDKLSDYRAGSTKSSAAAADSEPLLSEADVLASVRDSPPPSPSSAPPIPVPHEDSLDVTFVNVPTPISAPSSGETPPEPPPTTVSSPSRREFRLSSIRPKIYERLQRHVHKPGSSAVATAPVPAPVAIVAESVTLSALQGKYIDEEAIETAEEALESSIDTTASQVSPERPPGSGRQRLSTQELLPPQRNSSARRQRSSTSVQGLPPPVPLWRRLKDSVWTAVTSYTARILVALVAVVLAAPLPPFAAGLLLGTSVTLVLGIWALSLAQPPALGPTVTSLQEVFYSVYEERPTLMHKGWLHELITNNYDEDAHPYTEARFIRLEGSMLRLSHPKGRVPRRAVCGEQLPNLPFVEQRIYDIAGCSVGLLPSSLPPGRRWNRKFPIVLRLDNCLRVTRSKGLAGGGQTANSRRSARRTQRSGPRTSSQSPDPAAAADTGESEEEDSYGSVLQEHEKTLYLFARTDRGKEEWHRLLRQATMLGAQSSPASPDREAAPPVDSGAAAAGAASEADDGAAAAAAQPTPRLDFDYYMSKLVFCHSEVPSPRDSGGAPYYSLSPHGTSTLPRIATDPANLSRLLSGAGQGADYHVMWFNALIGRVAFGIFGSKRWAEFMQAWIQRRLVKLKLPYFMEGLAVTSCDLGSVVPRILSVSRPRSDQRGLWVDMTIVYDGGAFISLRTKANLMKLGKEVAKSAKLDKAQEKSKDKDRKSTRDSDKGLGLSVTPMDLTPSRGASPSPSYNRATDEPDGNTLRLADVRLGADEMGQYDESSSDDDDVDGDLYPPAAAGAPGGTPAVVVASSSEELVMPASSINMGKRILQVVDRVTTSRYFQQAAQNRYVKRYMEDISNTPLELTVNMRRLRGVLTCNIPRPPTDRLWFGFRGRPEMVLSAQPRLGTRDVTLTQITDWIEHKLVDEIMKRLVLPNMEDVTIPLMTDQTDIFASS